MVFGTRCVFLNHTGRQVLYTEKHTLAAYALRHIPQSVLETPPKMLGLSPKKQN